MMTQRSKSRKKKYLVKEEDGIFTVYDDFFNDIESRDEALAIAIRTLGEIHSTLIEESNVNETLYVGNMKVTNGLNRCLDELDKRWPFLTKELYAVPRKVNGYTLHTC